MSLVRAKLIWLAVLISDLFYLLLLVLVLLAIDQTNAAFSLEGLMNWKGVAQMDEATYHALAIGFALVGLLITTGVTLLGGRLMEGSKNTYDLVRSMLIGTSIAQTPGIFGLVLFLFNGEILHAAGFSALSMAGKIKFYPGFYPINQNN